MTWLQVEDFCWLGRERTEGKNNGYSGHQLWMKFLVWSLGVAIELITDFTVSIIAFHGVIVAVQHVFLNYFFEFLFVFVFFRFQV